MCVCFVGGGDSGYKDKYKQLKAAYKEEVAERARLQEEVDGLSATEAKLASMGLDGSTASAGGMGTLPRTILSLSLFLLSPSVLFSLSLSLSLSLSFALPVSIVCVYLFAAPSLFFVFLQYPVVSVGLRFVVGV